MLDLYSKRYTVYCITATKNETSYDKNGLVQPLFHLIHATSNGKPLCGETSPDVRIGAYVEHLDGASADNVRWVREICGSDGKPVSPCPSCLSLYPPVLIDIALFKITINLQFSHDKMFKGYNVATSAIGAVGNKRRTITACPRLLYLTAAWIGNLQFCIDVDANPVIALIEHANKVQAKGA